MGLGAQKQCLGSTALSEHFLNFTASLEKCDLHWQLLCTLNYNKTIRAKITFAKARVLSKFYYLPVKKIRDSGKSFGISDKKIVKYVNLLILCLILLYPCILHFYKFHCIWFKLNCTEVTATSYPYPFQTYHCFNSPSQLKS